MQGYFQNPEATAAVLKGDGWLDSGDMGYLIGGELVVSGRTKDLIIVGGRNIWPQDIEWAVEKLDAVRAGDVAAFSVGDEQDRERLVVVVECRLQQAAEQATASPAGGRRRQPHSPGSSARWCWQPPAR
jgi:fatty-acyl-CoA synthase